MLKRSLACLSLVLFVAVAYCGAQNAPGDSPDFAQQIKELKAQNDALKTQLNAVEEKVDQVAERDSHYLDRLFDAKGHPNFNLNYGEDPIRSGFIRKGSSTGTIDKLLNLNLYLGARYSRFKNIPGRTAMSNNMGRTNDDDGFSVPFARIRLSGQAYTAVEYEIQYDFETDRLSEGNVSWVPDMTDFPVLERFRMTAGVTRIFLSPAGQIHPYALDFIQYPEIVNRFLPTEAVDTGVYMQADAFDQGRLKFWVGLFNGTYRTITFSPKSNFNDIVGYDAYGNGDGNDPLATMARMQVNVLDEENYFLMFTGGFERNSITYTLSTGGGPVLVHENKTDTIYDTAAEFRFNRRMTWVRGEYMHTYLADTSTNTMWGGYAAVGSRLDFIHDSMSHFEVMARLDYTRLNDHLHSADDVTQHTVGLNFYFDPEHKHDAKIQVNYVVRDDQSFDSTDKSLLVQFVFGF